MREEMLTETKQGSGKTTLLEHILKSPDHGLRIAVIVNDMSRYVLSPTLPTLL